MDNLRIIREETERFLAAIERAAPGTPVPTCPDWTADDLLWHLTDVHAFWARILSSGALTDADSEAVEADKPSRPPDRETTIAMLRRETDDLVAQLARRGIDEPAWSWFPPDQTVGFTLRMQTHEATMHRVDAELTANLGVTPLDPEVAEEGIGHAVSVMLAWWGTLPGFEFRRVELPVELAASDVGRRWLLQPGRWIGVGQSGKAYDEPGIQLLEDSLLRPEATFTGTVEELDRWLWGRGVEPAASGDEPSLDAVRAAQAKGIQ